MTAEAWHPAVGFPGYLVSSEGRVVSQRRGHDHELSTTRNTWGYLMVNLTGADGKRYARTVHRLVADAFLGPCPLGMETCHRDGDKNHNAVSNLRFGTKSENALDRVRHGADRNARKTHCPSGHEYTPENTYVTPSRPRARYCRPCRDEHRAARRRAA